MLTLHHDIEEQHFFPMLASRMAVFRQNERMKTHHKEIHAGLVQLESYVSECSTGQRELRLSEMRDVMDSFAAVLWTHLDEEVQNLGAENMRKYWTLDDMRRFPIG